MHGEALSLLFEDFFVKANGASNFYSPGAPKSLARPLVARKRSQN